ncbi:3D domain-containing protein [Psychrobacillus sp. NPDC058041]|uniref:3D domain-containing protein n=1 Tax=Psychrobacillus sp. NPDC058041 TaxID=3346310 RepID=UPI0036D846CE
MRARTILCVLLFALSSNSVSYAHEIFPVATYDQNLSISKDLINEVVANESQLEEYYVHFEDAYNMRKFLEQVPETYTVVKGDNLYRIAMDHNISLESLMTWNGLTGDLIYPDDVLIVSGDEEEIGSIEAIEEPVTTVSAPIISPPPVGEGKEILVTATAYTAYCNGCSGTTAYGIDLRANPDQKVIAVDPRIIPLGTKVWVEGYGEAIAGDTGGAIKGNKIDVFIPSYDSAMQWGVKKVKIRVIN